MNAASLLGTSKSTPKFAPRVALVELARSTCALLLHELRRYVRIPLVIAVSIEGSAGRLFGSTREISGGGMSVQLTGSSTFSGNLRLSFSLPDNPSVSIAAIVCWQNADMIGFQFDVSDPGRQVVKNWIDAFLGLN